MDIYTLKRQFGKPMALYTPVVNTPNRQTGKVQKYFTVQVIKRGIVLPTNLVRTFIYDSAYNAVNRRFSYGALFDKETTVVLIDKSDATVTRIMHIEFDSTRFEINDFDSFENAWIVVLKRVEGYE